VIDCVGITTEEVRDAVEVRNPVDEDLDEDLVEPEQVPNLAWHPALQYAALLPHLKRSIGLYLVREPIMTYHPYGEQQSPHSAVC
jgi:hypothetical protein